MLADSQSASIGATVTDFNLLMQLKEQNLRTRVMVLEHAIRQFLDGGDVDRLRNAYSNDWVQPIGENDE